jgi:hypothetical protein
MRHVRAAVRYDGQRLAVTITRDPYAPNAVGALLNVDEVHPLTADAASPDLFELLDLTVAFYALDRSVERNPNNWVRNFEIEHPVSDVERWKRHVSLLAEWFEALTDDIVEVRPVPLPAHLRPEHHVRPANFGFDEGVDVITLLSDGLDSLCGLDAALRRPERHAFASVITNPKRAARIRNVIDGLSPSDRRPLSQYAVKTNLWQQRRVREKTQRSRTVLAIVTGMTVAKALGAGAVESNENGFGIMNLPVPDLQYGAMSSQVLNPTHLPLWDRVSRAFFERTIEVRYPNRFVTKAEMLRSLSEKARALVAVTSSCDSPIRKAGLPDCGTCGSCYFRKLAIACSDIAIRDVAYANMRVGQGPNAARLLCYHAKLIEQALRERDPWTALVALYGDALEGTSHSDDGRLSEHSWPALADHHAAIRDATIKLLWRHVGEVRRWQEYIRAA